MQESALEMFCFTALILLLVYLVYRIFEAFSRAAWMGPPIRRHFSLIESRTRTKNGAATSAALVSNDRRHFDSGRAFPALDDFICA